MKKIDKDGVLLCELQARAFELSSSVMLTSSAIFIRRFMNSKVAKSMDSTAFLQLNIAEKDILDSINEEYGVSQYGKVKYTKNELYWIGYIYRYYAYTYGISSRQAYKLIKAKELRDLFLPYHTMDPAQAIERILESKGLALDEEEKLKRQYEVFRKIRVKSTFFEPDTKNKSYYEK